MKSKHLDIIDQNFKLHSTLLPSLTAGMSVERTTNLTYSDCGISCDTFNIVHVTDGQYISSNELEIALEHYLKQGFDFCLWVSKTHLTDRLRVFLKSLRLDEVGREPGLVLNLAQYVTAPIDNQESIRIVTSKKELQSYAYILSLNWSPPDQHLIAYYDRVSKTILKQDGLVLACYYVNDEPVATVELFPTDNKTVGIYNLSTHTGHRGKGIGTALMNFVLNLAKERGYEQAVLLASEDGVNIYRKLGFKETSLFFEFKSGMLPTS